MWPLFVLLFACQEEAQVLSQDGQTKKVASQHTAPRPVETQAIEVGEVLPDVALEGLNGPVRNLASFRGRPLIINVWASWCGPCRAEMASLERLAWRQDLHEHVVIGISTDDSKTKALNWLSASNATIPHFIDRELVMERLLGASRIPLTVLVDSNGRVVAKVRGARDWSNSKQVAFIKRLLVSQAGS